MIGTMDGAGEPTPVNVIEGQLGLEPDPADFLESMVGVFRQVRRVLRRDGTLWLNMGDTLLDGLTRLALELRTPR